MSIAVFYDFSWMVPSAIMIILWLIMLVHIFKGNRNKWLFTVVVMLIFGAVGSVLEGWTLYELTVRHVLNTALCYWFGLAVFLTYCLFGLSHYLLAVKYRQMARNVPLLLEGKPEQLQSTSDAIVYWLLLFLNIAAPILLAYSGAALKI
jgi:hypothetical protein